MRTTPAREAWGMWKLKRWAPDLDRGYQRLPEEMNFSSVYLTFTLLLGEVPQQFHLPLAHLREKEFCLHRGQMQLEAFMAPETQAADWTETLILKSE